MDSRERIIKSINHRQPDRVPIDLGATPSSGISAIACNNLKRIYGTKNSHTRIYYVVQELAQPEDEIIERFNIDVLDIGRMFNTDDRDWYELTLSDGSKAEYPSWFKPVPQEDGSLHVYHEDGALIAKKAGGATFFDQSFNHAHFFTLMRFNL